MYPDYYNRDSRQSTTPHVGFLSILFLVLLVLKLCKVIDWSWWWVTAPLWIPIGILIICLIAYLIIDSIQ